MIPTPSSWNSKAAGSTQQLPLTTEFKHSQGTCASVKTHVQKLWVKGGAERTMDSQMNRSQLNQCHCTV
ncbi:hypothetical protein INR49_003480 [Caranx melampygus]|nr:hypothetical protein INR49_003480 [Caranx melampygus]